MKSAKSGLGVLKRRRATGSHAAVIFAIVVVAGVVVTLAVTDYTYSSSQQASPTLVTLRAIAVNGSLVTSAAYKVGDPFDLSITEQSAANPVAVREAFNGTVYPDHPWNVTATGHTYVLDDTAHANDLGSHSDYVVVTFDNGQQTLSNTVTVTIANGTA